MAKKYDEMDIEELKKRAAESEQRYAALKEISKSDPAALKSMSTDERIRLMRENEQERVDKWHQQLDDGRARYMKGIASATPGRYAQGVQEAAVKWLNENGYGQEGERRRQFDVTNETERIKAEQEAAGKIGYGSDAAKAKAAADEKIAQTEWGAKEKIAQGEIAAKKYLAETESHVRRYGIDAEHGVIGPDGKVTPGSRERTAQIAGESEVKKQEAANKGLLAQAEITRQNKEKELAVQIEKAQIAAGGKADSAKIASHAKIISAALVGGAANNKDAATVLAELAEQYKDDPEMILSIRSAGGGQQQQQPAGKIEKGTEKKFPNGDVGVWDGTKWVKKN